MLYYALLCFTIYSATRIVLRGTRTRTGCLGSRHLEALGSRLSALEGGARPASHRPVPAPRPHDTLSPLPLCLRAVQVPSLRIDLEAPARDHAPPSPHVDLLRRERSRSHPEKSRWPAESRVSPARTRLDYITLSYATQMLAAHGDWHLLMPAPRSGAYRHALLANARASAHTAPHDSTS